MIISDHAVQRWVERFDAYDFDECWERSVPMTFRRIIDTYERVKLRWDSRYRRDPVTGIVFILDYDDNLVTVVRWDRRTVPLPQVIPKPRPPRKRVKRCKILQES